MSADDESRPLIQVLNVDARLLVETVREMMRAAAPSAPPRSRSMSLEAAAKYARKRKSVLLAALKSGALKGSPVTSRRWEIFPEEVDAWLALKRPLLKRPPQRRRK